MTMVKASALTLGLAGAYALGVWTGPEVRESVSLTSSVHRPLGSTAAGAASLATAPAPRPSPAASRDAGTSRARVPLAASADTVRAYVKPLLNKGTDMELAAAGFRDAEQFMTVAHAARNTKIPFVVLKHRVLNERKSLTAAIREAKTGLNASQEAERARANAKAGLTRLSN
jgi:hypothetical protein